MAEPGDPNRPASTAAPDWDDDQIGFCTPASLKAAAVPEPEPEPEPDAAPEAEPEPEPAAPVIAAEPEPDLFDPAPRPAIDPAPAAMAAATPAWAVETPATDPRPVQPQGVLGLYSIYVLILFAVPTLGVSAAIGLLAVTGREPPADPVARSHFIYQQRTLWAAALAALLGAILIVVNIGVFVLFVLALWMMARGAVGVMRLKAGQAIADPRHWLF